MWLGPLPSVWLGALWVLMAPHAGQAQAALSSVSVSPATVVGGLPVTGTVTLNTAAPPGGAPLTLSSNNAAATVPATASVKQGATSATLPITTSVVTANVTANIWASYAGVTETVRLTVTPLLASLTLNRTSVIGGSGATGTITLNGPAPAGGTTVTLTSSLATRATVPTSVTVPAGTSGATFRITTLTVSTPGSTTITASNANTDTTAALTVTPYRATLRAGEVLSACTSKAGEPLEPYCHFVNTGADNKWNTVWKSLPSIEAVRAKLLSPKLLAILNRNNVPIRDNSGAELTDAKAQSKELENIITGTSASAVLSEVEARNVRYDAQKKKERGSLPPDFTIGSVTTYLRLAKVEKDNNSPEVATSELAAQLADTANEDLANLAASVAPTPTTSWESSFVWGLTDALVDRASQELSAWLVPKLAESSLCDTSSPTVTTDAFCPSPSDVIKSIQFPVTCELIKRRPEVILVSFDTVNKAVRQDLHQLALQAPSKLALLCEEASADCRKTNAICERSNEIFLLAYVGSSLHALTTGSPIAVALDVDPRVSPPALLYFDGNATTEQKEAARVASALGVMGIFARSLADQNGTISLKVDLSKLKDMSEQDLRTLLAAQPEVLRAGLVATAITLKDDARANFGKCLFKGEGVFPVAKMMTLAQSAAFGLLEVAKASAAFKETAKDVKVWAKLSGLERLQLVGGVLESTVTLSYDWIHACERASLPADACPLGGADMPRLEREVLNASQLAGALGRQQWGPVLADLAVLLKSIAPDSDERTRVLLALADVASAKDAASAKAAIENVIAGPGHYKLKRTGRGTYYTLNAYVGGHLGVEKAAGERATEAAFWGGVGGEVGWRQLFHWTPPFGIFLQALDVGALTSYRLSTSSVTSGGTTATVSTAPEVSLKQVFAPGLFLVVHIKDAPLSIGLGASRAPDLRKISVQSPSGAQIDLRTESALRLGLSVGLDLVLLP